VSTCPPISFPSRRGHVGSSVFQAVVVILRNRTGLAFTNAFNRVSQANADLNHHDYDRSATTRNFGRLITRIQNRAGLSAVASTERSADDVAALTKRFAPTFVGDPTATQWDVLWRTAEALDNAGVAVRLFNRATPDDISQGDWKTANDRAADVFALLDSETSRPGDRGLLIENAPPEQIRYGFRRAINNLMGSRGLDRRQAFDRLKEEEPIFWTLSILSFEPDSL